MNILLVRLRLIGDVVFTTPMLRALRRRYPDAQFTYLVESAAAPVAPAQPASHRPIVIPRRSGLDASVTTSRSPGDLAPPPFRSRHRSARRPARGLADLGQRRTRAGLATRCPDAPGCTPTPSPAPPISAPAHSVENQWDLLTPLGGRSARRRVLTRSRWAGCRGGRPRGPAAPGAGRLPRGSRDRRACQRGQPVSALAANRRSPR